MVGGGAQPRPPVAGVVGVRARQQRGDAARARACVGEPRVELGLAVKAAEAVVAAVVGAGELVGRRSSRGAIPTRARDRAGAVELAAGERGGDGGHRERPRRRARARRARRRARSRRRPRTRRARCRAPRSGARAPRERVELAHGDRRHRAGSARAPRAPRPDLLDRAAAAARGRDAVVVLGRGVDRLAVEQAELDADRLAVDLDRRPSARSSSQRRTGETRTPSAVVSRRIARATARSSAGRASAASTNPGRPFFICDRRDPDVERAGGEAALGGVGHELGREVVEVRLDQHRVAAAARRRRRRRRARRRARASRSGAISSSRVPAP